MKNDGGEEELARQALEIGWGRREVLDSMHLGLNRTTWRAGRDLWLTATDDDQGRLL